MVSDVAVNIAGLVRRNPRPLFMKMSAPSLIENDLDTYIFIVNASSKTTLVTAKDVGIIKYLIYFFLTPLLKIAARVNMKRYRSEK